MWSLLWVVVLYVFVVCSGSSSVWYTRGETDVEHAWCEIVRRPIPQTTVVLMFTCSRDEYLKRSLDALKRYHPREGFPVVISQDMQDPSEEYPKVEEVIRTVMASKEVVNGSIPMVHWKHSTPVSAEKIRTVFVDYYGYHKISRHYFWALSNVFRSRKVRRVIILEDDDEIGVDFFEYFKAMAPVLDFDPTLFCISAWNDNGKAKHVHDPAQLFRTDWMPGRGWMMTRRLWKELEPKWPTVFWDDWLRAPEQRLGRQCIRPEISRSANFGDRGVSRSHDFKKQTQKVVLNDQFVNFSRLDLTYLEPEKFEEFFFSRMAKAALMKSAGSHKTFNVDRGDIIVLYNDLLSTSRRERTTLDVHVDPRNGIHRASYRGIVIICQKDLITDQSRWIFLVHKAEYSALQTLPGGYPKPT